MRVEPDAVRRLVAAAADGTTCAAARVLSWDGRAIDFLRGTISFEARGFQDYYGEPVTLDRSRATDTFFPNGGAFAVARAAYDCAGGFDDAFFAYYDDVDLGWRLRLDRARHAASRTPPSSTTGTARPAAPSRPARSASSWSATRCGRVVKNYGEDTLRRTLGPVLLLAARRLLDEARIEERAAGPRPIRAVLPPRHAGHAGIDAIYRPAPNGSAAPAAAGERLILGLPAESLAAIGAVDRDAGRHRAGAAADPGGAARRRARRPAALRPCLRVHLELRLVPADPGGADRSTRSPARVHAAGAAAHRQPRSHRHQHVGARGALPRDRAGPVERRARHAGDAGRAGRARRPHHHRRLRSSQPVEPAPARRGLGRDLRPGVRAGAVPVSRRADGADRRRPLLPVHDRAPRTDAQPRTRSDRSATTRRASSASSTPSSIRATSSSAPARCSATSGSARCTAAAGSTRAPTPRDPTLRRLIDVVPFGLPDDDFESHRGGAAAGVLKGVRPGIATTDTVLLWGGSLLDWQDPETLIEAVAGLSRDRPDAEAGLHGHEAPQPAGQADARGRRQPRRAPRRSVCSTRTSSSTTGCRTTERAPLSGRSRSRRQHASRAPRDALRLPHADARLPLGAAADRLHRGRRLRTAGPREGLGATVPPGDPAALAAAIERLLDDDAALASARTALGRVGRDMHWSRVVAPLARFLEAPASAADHAVGLARVRAHLQDGYRISKWLKRTALRIGVTERRVEQLKQLGLVRGLDDRAQPRRTGAGDAARALTVLHARGRVTQTPAARPVSSGAHTGLMHGLATCDTPRASRSGSRALK